MHRWHRQAWPQIASLRDCQLLNRHFASSYRRCINSLILPGAALLAMTTVSLVAQEIDGRFGLNRLSLQHGIYGSVNDIHCFALPATESGQNLMSEGFVIRAGFQIRRSSNSFKLANSAMAHCIGTTTVHWRFINENLDQGPVTFSVLPSCSRDVILGSEFLRRTRTMTTNWHRLRVQPSQENMPPSVNILGDSRQSMAGTFRKEPIYALAGSGCEVNVVSERLIIALGVTDKVKSNRRVLLKLADGSLVQTVGSIRTSWGFGDETWAGRRRQNFVVLSGCPYDVVLGQEFLFAAAAFHRYTECVRDEIPTSRHMVYKGVIGPSLLAIAFRRRLSTLPIFR
jgi:hypothetical protein